jgi:hypothetical protein
MGTRKRALSRRGFIRGAGAASAAAVTAAGRGAPAAAAAPGASGRQRGPGPAAGVQPAVVHFQPDGGISGGYLAGQLAGHGQSVADLAFITSAAAGNLELLGRGGAGTFVKLNYLDGGGTERTGLAVSTATDHPVISVAPEAAGGATLDLENNDLAGVQAVVPSPDGHAQLRLDGLLALTPQPRPARPARGGVLYLDTAGGALRFTGSAGTVTTIAPA